MVDNTDTIAAIATPPGTGGVGVIRISGPEALGIAQDLIKNNPQENTNDIKARQAQFCHFFDEDRTTIDSGILIYFPKPASYTGEEVVELQGHGGRVVMSMLLERVIGLGARQARPGEFTERAFMNDKLDLLQAESVAALIDSASTQAVKSATRSLDGEFSQRINVLLDQLVKLRVFVEGALDFPEEEIDFIKESDVSERLQQCKKEIESVLSVAKRGARLNEGLNLAIIGRPNVGKSSLLNKLAAKESAIVSNTPGTTRDIVEENILIEGVPINILDTAGIRETKNDIEEEGIRRALEAAGKADIVLLVDDAEHEDINKQKHLLSLLPEQTKAIFIKNKIDLFVDRQSLLDKNNETDKVFMSAKTGEGFDDLYSMLSNIAVGKETNEDDFMARDRHISALNKTKNLLDKAVAHIEENKSPELIAEELLQAQNELGTITGKYVADDLLGEIFSSFCIGK